MNRLAEEHGFLGEPYPAQHPLANARQCWNWFKPDDQRRGWGGPSLISGITREVMRDARSQACRPISINGSKSSIETGRRVNPAAHPNAHCQIKSWLLHKSLQPGPPQSSW